MARLLQRLHQLALLVRRHPAEYVVVPHRAGVVAGLLEGGGVNIPLRPRDAGLKGHGGYGGRVVAGDHLYGHTLLGEVAEGLRRLLPDGIGDDRQGQGLHRPRDASLYGGGIGAFGQEQYPAALLLIGGDHVLQIGVPGLHDELRRTHHIGPVGTEDHRRPLVGGGEGDGALYLPQRGFAESLRHRAGGVVVRVDSAIVGVENFLHLPGGAAVLVQGHHLLNGHLRLGDGARLVHAQHVHMGQGLHGGQLVDQGLALGQPHDGHRQRHAGQQVQPLGDHADEGGHHGGHRLVEGVFLHHQLVGVEFDLVLFCQLFGCLVDPHIKVAAKLGLARLASSKVLPKSRGCHCALLLKSSSGR